MCSVFGFVAKQKNAVDLKIVREVIRANVHRGPHALGFSWVDAHGRLRMWKAPGNPLKMLGMVELMRGATMIVGHVRHATHGSPADNITNHPHPCDGGWIVHNGVLRNYSSLISTYRLVTVTECDSEVIGLLAERSDEKTHMGRLIASMETIGPGACVVMGLWNRPRKLVAARNGNPLHIGETAEGYYLGSLQGGLPGEVWQLKDQTAIGFTCRGIATDVENDKIQMEAESNPEWWKQAEAAGKYRGG